MASKKEREKARARARQAARKQAKESKRKGSSTVTIPDGLEFFSPNPENPQVITIMPFEVKKSGKLVPKDISKGERYFRAKFKTHRNVGPEEKMVVCPTTFGKACPICEEFNRQRKTDAEWDDIKELRPSDKELYLVAHKGKLCLMEMPWWWFGKLLDIEIEDDDREELFFFPEDKLDVRVSWEKDSFGTKAVSVRFKGRKEDLDEELVDKAMAIDLPGCVMEDSYKDIENLMHGVSDDDEGEDDDPREEPEEEEENTPDQDPEGDGDGGEDPEGDATPECFGKKFDGDDDDCDECDHRKDCKKAFKEAEKGKGKSGKSGKGGKGKKEDKPGANDKECPSGYKFGTDFDEFDECDDCDNADACEKAA